MMNTEQPLFSVATITFNSGRWVRQAIESILGSTFNDFELLISDDCSSDNTWEIINEYDDPRIIAWRNKSNIGEYSNRNKVLNKAKGKYFLFVDGDDILYKQTLRNLSEYVQQFPDAASVWGVPSAGFWFALLPYQFEPGISIRLIYETKIQIAEIGFAETLFKTECLREIGGFSTDFRIGDIWVKKVIATNYPIVFVPIGFMLWRLSEGQASNNLGGLRGGGYENFLIDRQLFSKRIKGLDVARQEELFTDIKSSFIKNMLRNSFRNFQFIECLKIFSELGFSFFDMKLIFRKRVLNYLPISDISQPLIFQDKN